MKIFIGLAIAIGIVFIYIVLFSLLKASSKDTEDVHEEIMNHLEKK
jgi:hypothetical protein